MAKTGRPLTGAVGLAWFDGDSAGEVDVSVGVGELVDGVFDGAVPVGATVDGAGVALALAVGRALGIGVELAVEFGDAGTVIETQPWITTSVATNATR